MKEIIENTAQFFAKTHVDDQVKGKCCVLL